MFTKSLLNRALASLEPSGLEMGREGEVESGSKAKGSISEVAP